MSTHSLFPDDAVPANSPGRQTVGQVMRPPTTTIEPEAHLAAAAYLIKHFHDSALVVVTDDTHEPVAMITDAEITRAVAHGRSLENTRISQVVTAKPVTVQADVVAEDAARLMLSQGVQHLPVVEGRRLVGMVELADLCRVSLAPGPFSAAAGTS
jgi:CBS domain-containing protein